MYACQSFLVLEDLSAVGFRMMDRLEGLDLDHCLLVMRSLARFHAASVALHEQDPDSLKQYDVSFYSEPSLYSSWKNSIDGKMATASLLGKLLQCSSSDNVVSTLCFD
jgi:hypothetical protein